MALSLASNQEALLVYSIVAENREISTYYNLVIHPQVLLKLGQLPDSTQKSILYSQTPIVPYAKELKQIGKIFKFMSFRLLYY